MALTKYSIAEQLQSDLGFPKQKALQTVESVLELIKATLESGDDVLVSGFGKFSVKEKKERRGRNPSTEEAMVLRARRVVTFKCSGNVRRRINGK